MPYSLLNPKENILKPKPEESTQYQTPWSTPLSAVTVRGMASTLRMRTDMSPAQWQPWTELLRPHWDSSAGRSPKLRPRDSPFG